MPQGPVNETLSRQFAVSGDDGLSDAERAAYDHCRPLSCKHEACYKRFMYSSPAKQRENCGPLFEEWKRCFEMRRAALEVHVEDGAAEPPGGVERLGGAVGDGAAQMHG